MRSPSRILAVAAASTIAACHVDAPTAPAAAAAPARHPSPARRAGPIRSFPDSIIIVPVVPPVDAELSA